MTPKRFWARLRAEADDYPLRRGAWYHVKKLGPREAAIDVMGDRVDVPRSYLEIMSSPPRRWSVVPRPKNLARFPFPGVEKYGVCPNCRERVPLNQHPVVMRCTRCNEVSDVAWEDVFLTEN